MELNSILKYLLGGFVLIVICYTVITIISDQSKDAVTYPSDTTAWSRATVPTNITLDEDDCVSLISVRNASQALPASNYTNNCVSQGKVLIKDNRTKGTTYTVTYYYDDDTTLTGTISSLMILLTVLVIPLMMIGIAIYFIKRE